MKLRASKPAAMLSTTARATSVATRTPRKRRRPSEDERPPSTSALRDRHARHTEAGDDTHGHAARHRDRHRKHHHREIGGDFTETRGARGCQCHQQRCGPSREHESEHRPRRRQHQAFDNHLLKQARSLRAQGSAQRQLALPCHTTRQHQVGHVHAGDQQHDADAAQQQQHHGAHRRHRLLVQGHDVQRTSRRSPPDRSVRGAARRSRDRPARPRSTHRLSLSRPRRACARRDR